MSGWPTAARESTERFGVQHISLQLQPRELTRRLIAQGTARRGIASKPGYSML